MFTYFHPYHPEAWEGQIKRGLIGANAGVRFCQSLLIPEDMKFNRLAAVGGDLWNYLRETGRPFYVDRLQGGGYIEEYDYDRALVNAYRELLGEKFLGFQMHEWMSNLFSDLEKMRRGGCTEWTEEGITAAVRREFADFPHLFLEAMTAKEYAEAGRPESAEEFSRLAEDLFARRMAKTDGQLIPCDSFSPAYPLEIAAGVRTFMPEIGWQTPDTRIQIAWARGMARAHGLTFGAYYEPWGGKPFSACCYHREGKNEWGVTTGADFPFETKGASGGSSRSMQKRMHLYAYFAGASYITEEWGLCNTFYDWHDYELTPYGEIKRDFLRLTEKYPDPGEFYAPVGIVLPRGLQVLQDVRSDKPEFFRYPLPAAEGERTLAVRRGVRALLGAAVPMIGNETHSLINSDLPDAFDVLCDGIPGAADRYEYLVDLTGGRLAKDPRSISPEEAPEVLRRVMPCGVEGGVHWFLTRAKDGWRLVILNNDGVFRTVADGERADPAADRTVTVTLKAGALRGLEGPTPAKTGERTWRFTVPAGEWFLGAFGE